MYTVKKPNNTTVEIKIATTPQEWEDAIKRVYERTKGKYAVQGFRKGHVPQKVIEKTYGDGVFFEDAFADLAEEAYHKVLAEDETIRPFGEPSLKLDKFIEGKLEGTLTLTVIPPVKLGKYTGLEVKAHLGEFDESMVEHELKHAQEENVKLLDKKGASAKGDVVTIDFKGSVDGVAFDGGTATDYDLHLGSKTFIDNFEDQLVGKNVGDKVDVHVTFPKDYNAANLAGKPALFECVIKAVKTRKLPAIDDALAKEVADIDTLDAWKADIREAIVKDLERRNKNISEDAILDAIVQNSVVELPEALINQQLEDVMQDLSYRLSYQGITLEDYAKYSGITVQQIREEKRKDAERIAKMRQVLEAIVRAEKLSVTDKELDAKLSEFAKMANKTLQEYKKTIDPQRIDYLYSDILMSKVMNLLTTKNTIVNKCDCQDKDCKCHEHKHECDCGEDCECKKEKKTTAKKSTTTKKATTAKKTTKTTK